MKKVLTKIPTFNNVCAHTCVLTTLLMFVCVCVCVCVCVRNKTDIKKEKDILKRVTKRETRERQCVREIVLSSRDDSSKYWVSGEEKLCIE